MVVALKVKASSIDTKLRRQRSNLSLQVGFASKVHVAPKVGFLPQKSFNCLIRIGRSRSIGRKFLGLFCSKPLGLVGRFVGWAGECVGLVFVGSVALSAWR